MRLETASLLKSVIQYQLISNSVVKLCVPEFLMRLTDTRGEIRAAYSTLLEVVPTCVITRWVWLPCDTPTSTRHEWVAQLHFIGSCIAAYDYTLVSVG